MTRFWALSGVVLTTVLLLVACLSFVLQLRGSWREYQHLSERRVSLDQTLTEVREERLHQERYLRQLVDDPELIARELHLQLGYIRPGETVFRFPEPAAER